MGSIFTHCFRKKKPTSYLPIQTFGDRYAADSWEPDVGAVSSAGITGYWPSYRKCPRRSWLRTQPSSLPAWSRRNARRTWPASSSVHGLFQAYLHRPSWLAHLIFLKAHHAHSSNSIGTCSTHLVIT